MRLKITGKNITLTEGIKSAVKDKIKKIEKLVGDEAWKSKRTACRDYR